MWTPSTHEVNSVLLLDAPKRYEYLIKKVADQEIIWSLSKQDGWAIAADPARREAVPVWPHREFAQLCATASWSGYTPRAIELEAWMNRWISGMEKDNRLVAVFPTPNDKGVCVDPSRFDADIRQELENYE
jgi:hypothetical protein